ncbi:asparagine synthetase domain-containing protein CG17486 isoform X2 [Musca domestica]|uniref:Asparagine synthetase domain-containing protein CG17486 isoform X2 n=1 Tax=Musca domestica TaxID=7370 RepID=A0ABM3ULS8_MUSDO|nr:asparagine synthetase domain-containing protein CG17486 isoform X2 [Musca domestica]
MCGILCCFSKTDHECLSKELIGILHNRGPNSESILTVNEIIFAGFVLHHQGTEMCPQPIKTDRHIFIFNGDVFNLPRNACEISDTNWIFNKISGAKDERALISCFRSIEGPFSFILYDNRLGNLFFGRDSLGRNSLLMENSKSHLRILSTSYLSQDKRTEIAAVELPPLGIYKINKDNNKCCVVFPWQQPEEHWIAQARSLEATIGVRVLVECPIEPSWLSISTINHKVEKNSTAREIYETLLKNCEVLEAIDEFTQLLEYSVEQRVTKTTSFCAICHHHKSLSCNHSKIAILFSGGIDCTILAILTNKFVKTTDPIDLINVSFEALNAPIANWSVPDRQSAIKSFESLKKLCPHRKWNFIEVNVTRKELYTRLSNHIKHLIYPLNTVLDESIGCAFWFAAQGKGVVSGETFESTAKVVLVGSGADELFGGYVRHKNAYNRCIGSHDEKETSLLMELEKDWLRIPTRNLARDDRVISDSGRTPRAPFIEENVVKFVRSLKPSQRCCFLYEDGVGDKLFLRLLGYRMGLKDTAFLKKRAIQFGSKIANKKDSANDRSKYL